MLDQEDAIIDIPENRVRFFGTTGKMLLPSPATVAALIQKIPQHKVITTARLLKQLTEQFAVEGTCPITTQRALQTIANDASTDVAYWRVVNKNGGLIARYPGGAQGHAARLRAEGFSIDTEGDVPKLKSFKEYLINIRDINSKEKKMQPQIVTKPAFTVVGLRIRTKPMTAEIPQLWGQFGPRMDEVPHLAEPGVSYGLMETLDPEMSQLDYMAGESVTKADDLPTGMTSWTVPANTYAVFETTLPAIGDTFGYIYNTWLPTAGYQQVAAPYFERYSETFEPDDPTATISIYIPVTKQA